MMMMEIKKLNTFGIIKEALLVFAKNNNFITFAALISLPLLCFSLYFETSLQNFLVQTSAFLDRHPGWSLIDIIRDLNDDLFHMLLQLGFLYLVPFHLLELVTVPVIVALASKIYREDKTLARNDMFGVIKPDEARLRGFLVTYGYVVFFSTCTLLGFIALIVTYAGVLRYFPLRFSYVVGFKSSEVDVSIHVVYGANLLLLLGNYLGWSAVWNLGLVMSVLRAGTYGAKALGSAAYLSLRSVHNGMILMLVFSIWAVGLRLPCLVFRGYKTWVWVVAQTGLFWLGNALKWVSFVVYFDDCIKRIFAKKIDLEGGQDF